MVEIAKKVSRDKEKTAPKPQSDFSTKLSVVAHFRLISHNKNSERPVIPISKNINIIPLTSRLLDNLVSDGEELEFASLILDIFLL